MGRLRSASFALPLCAALVSGAAFAQNQNNGGLPPFIAAPGGDNTDNHGHFVCTAAITGGGGVFSGEYVNAALTSKLALGTYQVAFRAPCPNVQIANGWFRIAQ